MAISAVAAIDAWLDFSFIDSSNGKRIATIYAAVAMFL